MPSADSKLLALINDNWRVLRACFFGATIFTLLFFAYSKAQEQNVYQNYLSTVTQLTSKGLEAIGIDHKLERAFALNHQDLIVTELVNVRMLIDSNIDGVFPALLLCAAILAWGKTSVRKALYIVICLVILFFSNIARAIIAVAVDQHFPLYFNICHYFLAPVILIFLPTLLLFVKWVNITSKH